MVECIKEVNYRYKLQSLTTNMFETKFGIVRLTTPMLAAIDVYERMEAVQGYKYDLNKWVEVEVCGKSKGNEKKISYVCGVKRYIDFDSINKMNRFDVDVDDVNDGWDKMNGVKMNGVKVNKIDVKILFTNEVDLDYVPK